MYACTEELCQVTSIVVLRKRRRKAASLLTCQRSQVFQCLSQLVRCFKKLYLAESLDSQLIRVSSDNYRRLVKLLQTQLCALMLSSSMLQNNAMQAVSYKLLPRDLRLARVRLCQLIRRRSLFYAARLDVLRQDAIFLARARILSS